MPCHQDDILAKRASPGMSLKCDLKRLGMARKAVFMEKGGEVFHGSDQVGDLASLELWNSSFGVSYFSKRLVTRANCTALRKASRTFDLASKGGSVGCVFYTFFYALFYHPGHSEA